MTIDTWLQSAIADAGRRGLPELKPILETLARSTSALRAAVVNDDASGRLESTVRDPQLNPHSNPQSAARSPQSEGSRR
jgi:hypothetical protein